MIDSKELEQCAPHWALTALAEISASGAHIGFGSSPAAFDPFEFIPEFLEHFRPDALFRAVGGKPIGMIEPREGNLGLPEPHIGGLSGGPPPRIFLARSLAQEAELLLLDEPLTGLDAPSQDSFFTILDGLHSDDVTVLVATHDLNLAVERFDRVMLLNKQLIALGSGEEVLAGENLLAAYGGHMHRISIDGDMLLTDTCCDHGELE